MGLNFRLGKTQVKIEFWFLVVLMIALLADNSGAAPLMLLTVLLHEGAHLLMLLLLRVRVEQIVLAPYGVAIRRGHTLALTPGKEAVIYAAGPVVNLLLFAGIHFLAPPWAFHWRLFGAINLVAALFNLLPVASLDGGNLIQLWLGSGGRADTMNTVISTAMLLPLFCLSFFLLLRQGNATLLLTTLYLTFLVLHREERV